MWPVTVTLNGLDAVLQWSALLNASSYTLDVEGTESDGTPFSDTVSVDAVPPGAMNQTLVQDYKYTLPASGTYKLTLTPVGADPNLVPQSVEVTA